MTKKRSLSSKEQVRAIAGVAVLSFKIAPFAVILKLVGSVITALLPIATTYYAARTTTALAAAYNGDQSAHHKVITYIIITSILGLVMTAWASLDNYIQAKMRYLVETRVSNRMYEHFLSLEFWRYDDKDTIDTYDRALKFTQFYSWIFDRIATIASQFISIVSAILAFLVVNAALSLFILIAIIPGIYIQFRLSRAQIKHWNANVENRRMLNMLEWLITLPRFISELRLDNMVGYLLRKRTTLRDTDELERIHIERKSIPLTLLSDVLTAGAQLGALIWVAVQVTARRQPIGQFLYVQQVVSRAITSASSLVSTLGSIDEDIANLFDYELFMQLPVPAHNGSPLAEAPKVITVDHVSFKYPGDQSPYVLRDMSFTIYDNQRIAIVGENGAGKTTLIKLLTGLYKPSEGNVLLDNVNLGDIQIGSWHKQLSVLDQSFIAYDFATARDNVLFGDVQAKPSEKRLNNALRDAEAEEFTSKLPKGIDSYVNNWMEDSTGVKGADLSGGQWQRLALARSFYRDTPIVILDEPTSAIDALAEGRIFERLFSKQNRKVIIISHRLSTIRKADIIYMLKGGKIVETGTHDELVAKKGEFYRMFESQIK